MKNIMNNENTRKIFSYNGEISFEQFKDYLKVFPITSVPVGYIYFTIIYLVESFISACTGYTPARYSLTFYVIFTLFIIFCRFLRRKKIVQQKYIACIKRLRDSEYQLDFYEEYFIRSSEHMCKKIEYTYIKKIIENDKYFYLVDDISIIFLRKEILDDNQKNFIRNINKNIYRKKCK